MIYAKRIVSAFCVSIVKELFASASVAFHRNVAEQVECSSHPCLGSIILQRLVLWICGR